VHQHFDDEPPPKKLPADEEAMEQAVSEAEHGRHARSRDHGDDHGHRHRRRHRHRDKTFESLRVRYKKAIFIAIGFILALVTTWFVLVRANVPPTDQPLPSMVAP
jgi:hypothetical protein